MNEFERTIKIPGLFKEAGAGQGQEPLTNMEFGRLITANRCARMMYGARAQNTMVIEECGELLAAMAKSSRGRTDIEDVADEAADVVVVSLSLLAACPGGWNRLRFKLNRLEDRLAKKIDAEERANHEKKKREL